MKSLKQTMNEFYRKLSYAFAKDVAIIKGHAYDISMLGVNYPEFVVDDNEVLEELLYLLDENFSDIHAIKAWNKICETSPSKCVDNKFVVAAMLLLAERKNKLRNQWSIELAETILDSFVQGQYKSDDVARLFNSAFAVALPKLASLDHTHGEYGIPRLYMAMTKLFNEYGILAFRSHQAFFDFFDAELEFHGRRKPIVAQDEAYIKDKNVDPDDLEYIAAKSKLAKIIEEFEIEFDLIGSVDPVVID